MQTELETVPFALAVGWLAVWPVGWLARWSRTIQRSSGADFCHGAYTFIGSRPAGTGTGPRPVHGKASQQQDRRARGLQQRCRASRQRACANRSLFRQRHRQKAGGVVQTEAGRYQSAGSCHSVMKKGSGHQMCRISTSRNGSSRSIAPRITVLEPRS